MANTGGSNAPKGIQAPATSAVQKASGGAGNAKKIVKRPAKAATGKRS